MVKKGEKIVKKALAKSLVSKKVNKKKITTKEVIKQDVKKVKKIIKKADSKGKKPAKAAAQKPKLKTQAIKINLQSSFKEKLADLKSLQNQESNIIESAVRDLENDSRITVEKAEPLQNDRQKEIFMWTGVAFFMIVILVVWAYNLKAIFQSNDIMSFDNSKTLQMEELSAKMKNSVGEFKESLDQIRNINNTATTTVIRNDLFRPADGVATSTSATTSVTESGSATSNTNLDAEEINRLKVMLEKQSTTTPELE